VKLNKRILCADGFSMSVQANEFAYCEPRIDNAKKYEEVEIGFVTPCEEMLLPYTEVVLGEPTGIYPWVPRQAVINVIAKHGGIIEGELPSGIPFLEANR